MKTKVIRSFILFVFVCLLFSFAPVVDVRGFDPFTINVDTTADGIDYALNGVCSVGESTDGPCSLRAAIAEANFANTRDANVIINVPSGHYLLTIPPDSDNNIYSGALDIIAEKSSFYININGIGLEPPVIDANQMNRVLYIGGGGLVTLNNLVIRGGYLEITGEGINGAGIFNYGNLALNHVVVEENELAWLGEGISPYWSCGGGIYNGGPLQITDSSIQLNTSPIASAIYNSGAVIRLDHSTVRDNYASWQYTISNTGTGTFNIVNSTIAGNTGYQAVGIENFGNLNITSSTFSNSGMIASIGHFYGNVNINDSIFNAVPNQADTSYNCFLTSVGWYSNGHDVFSDDSCPATGTNDLSNTDPLLGWLGWWGGHTMTISLLQDSPAIDHRDGVCFNLYGVGLLVDDQRYFLRNDGKCDTGAFEGSVTITSIFLPLITR